ncbi:MAG: sigma-70 family RNA polymerase sigma factor [Rhodocyclaceae bacterium]|nr:sigma-70 family RNA polymerase sigma factor [Rhodocyclaceae bacterium]
MLTGMAGAADDAQLMARYAAGDVAAFDILYPRHKGPLYRYFAHQCGSADAAEELFEDVWLRLVKARERYEAKTRFTTFLYQIAHTCLVDHFRKSGRALTSSSDTGKFQVVTIPDPIAEELDPAFASARWSLVDWENDPADPAAGPGVVLSGPQRAERLRSALDALPLEPREAFLLHEEVEMGLAEIAAVTGANAETVRSRLRQAVQKLRTSLGDVAAAGNQRVRS